jgi:hypothetical protein
MIDTVQTEIMKRLIVTAAALLLTLVRVPDASVTASNPIVVENQNPGTNAWRFYESGRTRSLGPNHRIVGYPSATSVNKGQPISFHVSVYPTQTFDIDIYRLGYYGGTGGRLMLSVNGIQGQQQPDCPLDISTGLVECRWSRSYTLTVPMTWTTGIYMVMLKAGAANFENQFSFAVRDDSRAADILYQQPVTTYQAYNDYPRGTNRAMSLYDFNSVQQTTLGTRYAVKVSFDRPLETPQVYDPDIYPEKYPNGDSADFGWETDLIAWLEKEGYDVSYTTDVDTHVNPTRLLQYEIALSAGHDEYWTSEMMDAWERARDAGIDLVFSGADVATFQIRFEPSAAGVPDRIIVCYKVAALDPEPVLRKKAIDMSAAGRPPQQLVGVQYITFHDNPIVQTTTVRNTQHWAFEGTGLTDGAFVGRLNGYEVDRLRPEFPGPISTTYAMLAEAPFVSIDGFTTTAQMSIYQAPSGAWVFASGTSSWPWALNRPDYVNPAMQRKARNIFTRMLQPRPRKVFAPAIQR